jgi:hydroxymethylglutaryl-CoA reductase
MDYSELDISEIIQKLDTLNADSQPIWGEMSAQRMVEHLTDTIKMASGKVKFPLVVPEDKFEKMLAFLDSDKPMARNIEVSFAKKSENLRNEEIELAIDEFLLEWIDFEEHYSIDSNRTELHPYYGPLNYVQWCKLHAKHLAHHFAQFGIEN